MASPQPLEQSLPEIHSFAKNKLISVSHRNVQPTSLSNCLHTAAKSATTNEATTLENSDDVWSYRRSSSKFLSSRVYKKLIGHHPTNPAFSWVWKCLCEPKHKVFCWLLLKDRLSTRNILRRKHMNLDSYNCELCALGVEETTEHLFLHCPFA